MSHSSGLTPCCLHVANRNESPLWVCSLSIPCKQEVFSFSNKRPYMVIDLQAATFYYCHHRWRLTPGIKLAPLTFSKSKFLRISEFLFWPENAYSCKSCNISPFRLSFLILSFFRKYPHFWKCRQYGFARTPTFALQKQLYRLNASCLLSRSLFRKC